MGKRRLIKLISALRDARNRPSMYAHRCLAMKFPSNASQSLEKYQHTLTCFCTYIMFRKRLSWIETRLPWGSSRWGRTARQSRASTHLERLFLSEVGCLPSPLPPLRAVAKTIESPGLCRAWASERDTKNLHEGKVLHTNFLGATEY